MDARVYAPIRLPPKPYHFVPHWVHATIRLLPKRQFGATNHTIATDIVISYTIATEIAQFCSTPGVRYYTIASKTVSFGATNHTIATDIVLGLTNSARCYTIATETLPFRAANLRHSYAIEPKMRSKSTLLCDCHHDGSDGDWRMPCGCNSKHLGCDAEMCTRGAPRPASAPSQCRDVHPVRTRSLPPCEETPDLLFVLSSNRNISPYAIELNM